MTVAASTADLIASPATAPEEPMRLFVSASSIHRVAICPAAGALPKIGSINAASGRGTALHAFLAAVGTVGRDEALAGVPEEHRAACAALDTSTLPVDPNCWAAEVAWAYDWETGKARELGRDLGRDYPKTTTTEVTGTADVVGVDASSVCILDYKSGRGVGLAKAKDNWQLKFLALAACRTYGKSSAKVGLIHIDHDEPSYDVATFDALDLDAIRLDLREIMRRAEKAGLDLRASRRPSCVTGDHCKWCPSLPYCPAQTALIRSVVDVPERIENDLVPVSPEAAARAWDRAQELKMVLSRVEQALYAYAAVTPILLSSGLMLGPVETARESLDGEIAHAEMTKAFGREFADAACKFTSTKAGIKEAAKAHAKANGLKIVHVERQALAAIAAAGGVKRNVSTRVQEYAPGPAELGSAEQIAELEAAIP